MLRNPPSSPAVRRQGSSHGHTIARAFARPLVELLLILTALELALWWFQLAALRVAAVAVLIIVCAYSRIRLRKTMHTSTVHVQSVSSSLLIVTLVTLLMVGLLILLGWLTGAWQGEHLIRFSSKPHSDWIGKKLPTVFVQQLLLQLVVLPLFLELTQRRSRAVLLSGLFFGTVHSPNPVLMVSTCLAGMVWCHLYLKHGRFVPLVISHLILAILAANVGNEYVFNMRVGSDFLGIAPYTVKTDDGGIEWVFPRAVCGNIHVHLTDTESVTLTGWMADANRALFPNTLIVHINGNAQDIPIPEPRILRNDIADRYSNKALARCGFQYDVPITWFTQTNHVRLFARTPTGKLSELYLVVHGHHADLSIRGSEYLIIKRD